MAYKKPQDPLTNNGFGIYPLTTADQVILSDGSRLEKNKQITANNSEKLNNVAASEYALKTDTVLNSEKLGGKTLADIMLEIYPVGAVYISVNSTSPASLFGGTWERLKDRFLLGAGDSYAAGGTGGEATHTLTVNELPAHTHTATVYGINSGGYTANAARLVYKDNTTTAWISEGLSWVNSTGGSQSHNNLPPYLAVYMWRRVS